MNIMEKHKLYEEILNRLLEVIYLYKRSHSYSYIPDSKEDGWEYFTTMFNEIERELNKNLLIPQKEYESIRTIICEIKTFVRAFSGVDSLPQRYFDANPNLRFFTVAFGIQESDDASFYMVATNDMLKYVPKIKDFKEKDLYFELKNKENHNNNFKEDEDDYLMTELAIALREIFLNEICC